MSDSQRVELPLETEQVPFDGRAILVIQSQSRVIVEQVEFLVPQAFGETVLQENGLF